MKTDRKKTISQQTWKRFFRPLVLPLLGFILLFPKTIFDRPNSPILLSKDQQLLGAKIATDGQWHFHDLDSLSNKFETALIHFEDRNFYDHAGIDPRGFGRALWNNLQGKKRQGASTLSMQIARMAGQQGKRGYLRKLKEMLFALQLEFRYSKAAIIKMYASNAPFGGNIIGLDAASWRYFGKDHHQLSWAESCMLAVLPNAPGLIHPGRSRTALKEKRNRLLKSLLEHQKITQEDYDLAILEPLPEKPQVLPRHAQHLLQQLVTEHPNEAQFQSSLDYELQLQCNDIVSRYYERIKHLDVHNIGVLVIDMEKNQVVSYIGNTPMLSNTYQPFVDMIQASRSSGSVLKPLLFAKAIDAHKISPKSLLRDVPDAWGGYAPKNYNKNFEGLVPADESLYRSLNLPFVDLLDQYSHEKFLGDLQSLPFSTINRSADHYGLSLILGGAEISLWDLATTYKGMAKDLQAFNGSKNSYSLEHYQAPQILLNRQAKTKPTSEIPVHFSAAAIWHTFESLTALQRPGTEGQWKYFSSSEKIAWKTGTSHGFKDAWTIGLNRKYLVGVWVGNADGTGKEGLTGVQAAAPLFFQIFNQLPAQEWFNEPLDELFDQEVCSVSGFKPTIRCPKTSMLLPKTSEHLMYCNRHKWINCTADTLYQANKDCSNQLDLIEVSFFIPSPKETYYLKKGGRGLAPLPPPHPSCPPNSASSDMGFIYPPTDYCKFYIPYKLNEEKSKLIFSATHQQSNQSLFWHLNDQYLGMTETFHEMPFEIGAGQHVMLIKDSNGTEKKVRFEVIEEQ